MERIRRELFDLKDEQYRHFSSKLLPTIDKEKIIGIRTPQLRQYAKNLIKGNRHNFFLDSLPHFYHEENCLHAEIIMLAFRNDFNRTIDETERFLPYIDNWATCDCFAPKIFKRNISELKKHVNNWLSSQHNFTIRFGITTCIHFLLDKDFDSSLHQKICNISNDEYYVNMAIAWYISIALIKQYSTTIPLLEKKQIESTWVHNKAIQKACESLRIPNQQKEYLKTLKR